MLAARVQVLRELLEFEGPLMERQLAEFRLAGGATVIHDGGQV